MAEDKQKKNLTVFGQETEFDGVLEFTDNLVITGKFKGEIRATGDLEIEKGAVCDVEKMTASSIPQALWRVLRNVRLYIRYCW